MAVRRFGPLRRRSGIPCSIPPGFSASAAGRRMLPPAARIRARDASLRARVGRLRDALALSTRHIARNLKRLAQCSCVNRLVASAPPAVALGADAPRVAAFADTS
jgi:hypothetical protein